MARPACFVLSLLLLTSCSGRASRAAAADRAGACRSAVPMERSPGGTLQISPVALAASSCGVRVVDVRDAPSDVVPGAEHVPAGRILDVSRRWPKDDPVVLVCGSGSRAKHIAAQLQALGFTRAAALTGGMRAWTGLKLPLAARPRHPGRG